MLVRKIVISLSLLLAALCLIAVGFTFSQDLEYETLIFFLKWQRSFAFG